MTFTYGGDLTVDRDYVRFHTGDTTEDTAWLTDEVIASLITVETTAKKAVIAAIKYIISQLSRPDFTADWLSVSHGVAIQGYKDLLAEKRREFNIAALDGGVTHMYRADSLQTEEPDYD